jgi:quaternary ammonium compound-resistance protein SugE
VASTAGLGIAMQSIPTGTAYAVWVGVGAALTVAYAMLTGDEAFSLWKLVFIGGIIGAVIGLKLVPAGRIGAGTSENSPSDPAASVPQSDA